MRQLDAQQKWYDIHFLNTALRETSKVDRKPWIESDLIQFFVGGGKEKNNASTVRCFDGFAAEYSVSRLDLVILAN